MYFGPAPTNAGQEYRSSNNTKEYFCEQDGQEEFIDEYGQEDNFAYPDGWEDFSDQDGEVDIFDEDIQESFCRKNDLDDYEGHWKTEEEKDNREAMNNGLIIANSKCHECSEELNQNREGDMVNGDSELQCVKEEGRTDVIMNPDKKLSVKKLKTLKPARRSDRHRKNIESTLRSDYVNIRSKLARNKGNLLLEDTRKAEALGVTYESDESAGKNEEFKLKSEKDGRMKVNKECKFMGQGLKCKEKMALNCNICEKTFFQVKNLLRLSNNPHHCSECKRKFGRHLVTNHNRENAQQCSKCEKKFGKIGHLLRHLAIVHLEVNPHHCNECKMKFSRKMQFYQHMSVVHPGVKLHQGLDCKMKFGTKGQFKRHQAYIHGGEKAFQCTETDCDREFVVNAELLNHLRSKHSNTKLQCETQGCSAKFNWSSGYYRHKKIAHFGK